MLRVRNRNLSATMEAFFSTPAAFDNSSLKAIASKALQQFRDNGLRPGQICIRLGDQLYDYELSFSLFNSQAHFRFGSERLFVNVQNARGQSDAKILIDCMVAAAKCIDTSDVERLTIQAASHAIFENKSEFVAFFDAFVDTGNGVVGGGRIVLVQENDWPCAVRLSVEKSLHFDDAAFLHWSSENAGTMNLETAQNMVNRFRKAVEKVELDIQFE